MKREAFADCHPIVNFSFFGAVIAMTVFIMQPVCLVISLVSALVYLLYMQGAKKTFSYIGYLVPFLIAMVILNPLFNHEGMTIIAYLPNDNPITLEAIYFGVFSAVMMAASIVWFNCCNAVFTSDKIIYLFGRVIPAMSLLISMTLRFVPRFKNHLLCVM
ncbi:MAG: energy-coupling factor transporter transmembrane protein EcfT, partial [Oscillospiraceae bacterium]|nr:energy-coupling factor transporter transmembrane protein EcfT [Oscillospiraceae bacterium]